MVLAGSVGGVAVRDDPVAFAEAVDGAGAAARLFQWNLLPSTRVVMGPGECQWIPKPSCYGRWGVWQGWKGGRCQWAQVGDSELFHFEILLL